MLRTIQNCGCLAGAACFLLTAPASAQMLPTEWTEYIRLDRGYTYQEWRGQDTYFPEPLAHSITSTCTSVEGDITFGPPGPPLVMVHSEVAPFTCYPEGIYRAITSCYVTFNLRIVEKATPPVAVESVPLMIGIKSYLAATAQFSGGTAWLDIWNGAEIRIFQKRSDANYDTGPIQVDSTATVSIQAGAVLTGSMWVSVGSVAGVTTGSVGCDFEIASDLIPGTEYQYRDFFEIEYSSGYWALGNPTPVQTSTWGKIKAQYLQQ